METLKEFLDSDAGRARKREEWADLFGCRKSHLSMIENGKTYPSLALAKRIRELTGVSADSYVLKKSERAA